MTEVLVSENNKKKSEWYQFRPIIKSKELVPKSIELDVNQNRKESKSLWMKIKAKLFKKFKEGSKIKPVLSITEKKERVFVLTYHRDFVRSCRQFLQRDGCRTAPRIRAVFLRGDSRGQPDTFRSRADSQLPGRGCRFCVVAWCRSSRDFCKPRVFGCAGWPRKNIRRLVRMDTCRAARVAHRCSGRGTSRDFTRW